MKVIENLSSRDVGYDLDETGQMSKKNFLSLLPFWPFLRYIFSLNFYEFFEIFQDFSLHKNTRNDSQTELNQSN